MLKNKTKSSLIISGLSEKEKTNISEILSLRVGDIYLGKNYLGPLVKFKGYKSNDWLWLLAKLENKFHAHFNKCQSRVRRLIFFKVFLESISFY